MQVTLFKIPALGLTIRSFGVMAMLAFMAGIAFAIWRVRDKEYPPPFIMDLGIFCLVSGIIGARLFFVAQEHQQYNWSLFYIRDGGFSIPGAVLGLTLPLLLFFAWNLAGSGTADSGENPSEGDGAGSMPSGTWFWVLVGASVVGAVVLSRIVYVYTHPDQYVQTKFISYAGREHQIVARPFDFLKIWQGGMVFNGGLFGGMVGGTSYILWNGYSFLDVADVFAAPLLLAQSIARWGCFFAGDDFGLQVSNSFPLAVRFPRQEGIQSAIYNYQVQQGIIERGAEYTTWVHPAQLYMSFGVFVCLILLLLIERKKWFAGWSFGWMMILYAVHRFIVEFWRGDPLPIYSFAPIPQLMRALGLPQVKAGLSGPTYGLRISQLISLILLVGAVIWLVVCWWRSRSGTGAETETQAPAGTTA